MMEAFDPYSRQMPPPLSIWGTGKKEVGCVAGNVIIHDQRAGRIDVDSSPTKTVQPSVVRNGVADNLRRSNAGNR